MTRLEELALISRMSKALDDLPDYSVKNSNLRPRFYAGIWDAIPEGVRGFYDRSALTAQLARRRALRKMREAA